MANTNAPFGFKRVARADQGPLGGGFSSLKMQPTAGALNRGDLVLALADGTVAVSAAAQGHLNRGVYIGCHYTTASLGYPVWANYWPGSGAALGSGLVDVFIVDDPMAEFEGMASAGPITQADVGANCDVVVNASTTGFSKWSLGVPSAAAGGLNFPFKVLAVGNRGTFISDGYDVASANNIVRVGWNDMFLKGPAQGV